MTIRCFIPHSQWDQYLKIYRKYYYKWVKNYTPLNDDIDIFVYTDPNIYKNISSPFVIGLIYYINHCPSYDKIPLYNSCVYNASHFGYLDIIKFFIKKGATNKNSILTIASYNGRLDIVEYAISIGANDLNDALSNASLKNHPIIINYLLDHGANDYNQALISSSIGGHTLLVDYYIDKGATTLEKAMSSAKRSRQYYIVDKICEHMEHKLEHKLHKNNKK